jgi:hypothetical protein
VVLQGTLPEEVAQDVWLVVSPLSAMPPFLVPQAVKMKAPSTTSAQTSFDVAFFKPEHSGRAGFFASG